MMFINFLSNNVRKENKMAVAVAIKFFIIHKRQIIFNFYFMVLSHSGIP